MKLQVIGQTVNFWRGGESGGTAKIISIAKPIKLLGGNNQIYDDCRVDVVFLAKTTHNEYVLIRPRFYWGNKHPTGEGLYINWELNFDCAFPNSKTEVFNPERDKLGFRLDYNEQVETV